MSTRRERARAKGRTLVKETVAVTIKEKNEVLFEFGKSCFDLSKLAFGGVVLINALHFTKENAGELLAGIAFMAGFLVLGGILIKRATKKKEI